MNLNMTIEDFFSQQNSEERISDSDYEQIGFVIEAARAFERITSQCVYIIDCFKKEFRYVSSNISRLCGWEAENIRWKNRSRLGQCAGADWDTFDAAKLMIFSETVAF